MKKETLVVVANSSFARLYKAINNHAFEELETWEHPESRLHDQDLVTSRPGRAFDSFGPGRHAMETKVSPKTQEFQVFASTIANHLEKAVEKGDVNPRLFAAGDLTASLTNKERSRTNFLLKKGDLTMKFFYQLIVCVALVGVVDADETQKRFNDMRKDEFESTDSLAIPLDSSELEQEEELEDLERMESQNQHHNNKFL
jgi:protein required for attachment to host cells